MVSSVGAGLSDAGSRFELLDFAESPRAFHGRTVPDGATPQIWLNTVTEPALVLGSTQRDLSIVDEAACAAAAVDVVRRRSGGGAVLLLPGEVTWFDVVIPTGGPGWADDVHAPMVWLGHRLAAVFASVTGSADDIAVHDGRLISTEHSRLLCFDGIGPGEVLLGGAKLVGISQRRTRSAARLQCCWYHHYDPAALVSLLAAEVRPALADLEPVSTVDAATSSDVVAALAGRLSTPSV